ncbi:hypothetical protein HMI54_014496 [Coelomomyces lativittatus]|nr:hypothetical protein HMI55_000723 [Coelomomyces lativittatus]KAJ1508607.1 hypothetical protein HMI56_007208 [Coelomomyces lativittatus]KAJ1514100.1 hypothetical protein HMI54_014496 [Coelomomyces lativittatus]
MINLGDNCYTSKWNASIFRAFEPNTVTGKKLIGKRFKDNGVVNNSPSEKLVEVIYFENFKCKSFGYSAD